MIVFDKRLLCGKYMVCVHLPCFTNWDIMFWLKQNVRLSANRSNPLKLPTTAASSIIIPNETCHTTQPSQQCGKHSQQTISPTISTVLVICELRWSCPTQVHVRWQCLTVIQPAWPASNTRVGDRRTAEAGFKKASFPACLNRRHCEFLFASLPIQVVPCVTHPATSNPWKYFCCRILLTF